MSCFNFFKNIFYSLIFTVTSTILSFCFIYELIPRLIEVFNNIDKYNHLDEIITFAFVIFGSVWFIFSIICCSISAIKYMVLYFYYTFFGNDHKKDFDKIYIKIDQNNCVMESYMECKNGKTIPIDITHIPSIIRRVKLNVPEKFINDIEEEEK